jgi:hypothetical protein
MQTLLETRARCNGAIFRDDVQAGVHSPRFDCSAAPWRGGAMLPACRQVAVYTLPLIGMRPHSRCNVSPSARDSVRAKSRPSNMDLQSLQKRYATGENPLQIATDVLKICEQQKETFLHVPTLDQVSEACQRLESAPASTR